MCEERDYNRSAERAVVERRKIMEDFFAIRRRDREVVEEYFTLLQQQADHFKLESGAATTIQSGYRGSLVRERWHAIWLSVRLLQRAARGMLGRLKARARRMQVAELNNMAYFSHCAATV